MRKPTNPTVHVGEVWFVKTKPGIGSPLLTLKVKEVTPSTVLLVEMVPATSGRKALPTARYKLDEIEFVEKTA